MNPIRGSGGGGCFAAGTQIAMPELSLPIEQVRIGDRVIAFNDKGKLLVERVECLHVHENEPIWIYRFWGDLEVFATPNHLVLNQYGKFAEIGTLTEQDAIIDGDGHLRPLLSSAYSHHGTVFNLTVSGPHTYIANGIRVHNTGSGVGRLESVIRGSGGGGGDKGGGGGHTPTESPDSLRSRQYARVIDLVSEGEIGGLVNGLKSVYLDDTPIESSDGTVNFQGITLVTREGTQPQSYIPGFPSVEAERAVGTKVLYATPVTRSISNTNTNAVRVTIGFPRLTYLDPSNGDISGTSVDLAIDVQNNGGGYVQKVTDTVSGKTTSRYQRAYRIELPAPGPWDIRVRRLTADSTQSNLQNEFWWDSFTEIIDSKLRYPNSALCALSVDSSHFNRIPTRGYEIKGIKVRIPSNYNPITRVYTGAWDGTFTTAWTDNPAWCFYDLITNERYGLGAFIKPEHVDKWALYTIGQYCDQLVPNGFGGTEPRFTCNLYLQTREEAYRVINSFASIFRGMAFWAGGAITAIQDAPKDVSAIFAPANVVGGQFNYEGSSAKARHTVALVTWNDPADRYRQKIEYVEDPEGIARYGVIQTETLAVGCTSRGQAHRLGRWILYTERMESETVSFRTGIEGLAVYPGDIIQTTDPVRAGIRMGGRIVSATTSAITIDSAVTIVAGSVYTLWVAMPDGTVKSAAVTNAAGSTTVLTVSPAFSVAPVAPAMWVLAASNLSPETWRVMAITEIDGTQAEIIAVAHNPSKFAAIEQNLILEQPQTSVITQIPTSPTNLIVSESLYLINPALVGARITVSWQSSSSNFELRWRRAAQNWNVVETTSPSFDIHPAEPGMYEFSVVAINSIGKRSAATTLTKEIFGLATVPANVTGFTLSAINGSAHLSWNPATDLDVIVGGYLKIRHTPNIISPTWSGAVDIGPQIPGSATNAVLPLITGTYLAKWVDASGYQSAAEVGVITNAPSVMAMNFVANLIEHPTFPGAKTNVYYNDDYAGLMLGTATTIDDQTSNIDDWPLLSELGGMVTSGTYLFSNNIDLGSVQTSRITVSLVAIGANPLDAIDARQDVDTWIDVDNQLIDDVGCQIWIRTTNDNPSGSPTWSNWQPFVIGDYAARAFQFKATLTSGSTTHNVVVRELAVTVDMPDRIESGSNITSGAGTYNVTYAQPFMITPAVGITAQNMATGDYYSVTNKNPLGFSIVFRDASGTNVSRTFDYLARGY